MRLKQWSRPEALEGRVTGCMGSDQPRLHRELKKLGTLTGEKATAARERIAQEIARSSGRRAERERNLPRPDFPEELPVSGKRPEIARAIRENPVVVVCGETGSGKTTQLPKICLTLGRGVAGMIGHTQPRRIAARSVARRIAEELGSEPGALVGYKVRFNDRTRKDAYIKLMTDGILLAEIQGDRLLRQYDTLIIDEAHERSLNIDFLLGYLKSILPRRPDLKLIITSATIDPASFSRHFGDAPIIGVSGRTWPVEIRYRPVSESDERSLQGGILDAVDELDRLGRGDTLVFLPGERQIRETAEALRKHHPKGAEILPLYARLSAAEQQRVFDGHRAMRIILATNVAETSLTVPGIRYVIDTGTARVSRYSVRAKVQRLPIEPVSQASADQRAGRCGRTSPGVCVRLYDEESFSSRREFTDPEILRTNLAAVILRMRDQRLGDIEEFPFVEAPDRRFVNDGYRLLQELGAMDTERRLTGSGRELARLPVDPRLGRMVLAGRDLGCLKEILVIVSALAAQDPRDRPLDRREAADEAHGQFSDGRSDFLAFVRMWDFFHERARHLSKSRLRKLCVQNFVSWVRLREWWDLHTQLRSTVLDMGMREKREDADYGTLHRAILTGLLDHTGMLDEGREYLGARGRRFHIFPGSPLAVRPPKWVMAAELAETRRVYARTVAKIEPEWVEHAAAHLVKREYLEPHWQPRRVAVAAFERVTLYGLTLVPRRRVNYGSIDPVASREIFVREALVAGRYQTRARFFERNARLVAAVHDKEARSRRRDIMVDEEVLYRFYDRSLPANINNGRAFERWLKDPENDNRLVLTHADLMRHDAALVTAERFPDSLQVAGASLSLEYRFEPGDERDGVTLVVPLAMLNQIDGVECDWLVPGLIEDKLTALIRALPKSMRRNFVPAPDFAKACIEALSPGGDLFDKLSRELLRMTGERVDTALWPRLSIPEHLRLRFRVVDAQGDTLASGRDLESLRGELGDRVQAGFAEIAPRSAACEDVTDWNFGRLLDPVEVVQAGVTVKAYPALVLEGDRLRLRYLDTEAGAIRESRSGLLRLYQVVLADLTKSLRRGLPGLRDMCLNYRGTGGCDELGKDLVAAAFQRVFLEGRTLPRDQVTFEAGLDEGRKRMAATLPDLCRQASGILSIHRELRVRLADRHPPARLRALQDIDGQLRHLVYPGFLAATPGEWLANLPRYLKAVGRRLDRLAIDPSGDAALMVQVAPWWRRCLDAPDAPNVRDDPEFVRFRWMVEEFRVSLFAQALGTALPVSAKRLEAQWGRVSL
ncbi:MAG: ATP-dependent RNA helicase HrpA [Pseudomonadota bacterium]|nr:ATP-dependent RNA helicase HrpA [Pseudomonadota bacterium]